MNIEIKDCKGFDFLCRTIAWLSIAGFLIFVPLVIYFFVFVVLPNIRG